MIDGDELRNLPEHEPEHGRFEHRFENATDTEHATALAKKLSKQDYEVFSFQIAPSGAIIVLFCRWVSAKGK